MPTEPDEPDSPPRIKPPLHVHGNQIHVLHPYRYAGQWVFNDPRVELRGEPLMGVAGQLLDLLIAREKIKRAEWGFRLLFAATPFPGHQVVLTLKQASYVGAEYAFAGFTQPVWLCPGIYKYFERAPATLYIRVEAVPHEALARRTGSVRRRKECWV